MVMSTTLWLARLPRPLTEEEAARLLARMPPDRRARLGAAPEARREPLCAYGLLALALRRREGWRDLPEIALGERGKPYFPTRPGLHFSLSHTEGAVLAALSDRPVGADIQRVRPVSPEAMRRIAGTEDPEAFFRCWVRREARSKRTGQGMASMLRAEPPMGPEERYQAVEAFPGYAAGVSYAPPGPLEPPVRLGLEELIGGLS